jgi:hypothetical protein
LTASNGFSKDIFGEGVKDFEPCMGHGIKGPGKMLGLFINPARRFRSGPGCRFQFSVGR